MINAQYSVTAMAHSSKKMSYFIRITELLWCILSKTLMFKF